MRKRPGLAVATLALVLTLTGCGARAVSGTPSGDGHLFDNAQELVRAATGETDQVKSAKFSMTMTVASTSRSPVRAKAASTATTPRCACR